MNIGEAVAAAKEGKRVRRAGWNGKGMYVYYAGVVESWALPDTMKSATRVEPHMVMHTAQGTEQPGWLCSQADLLANDWELAD